MKKRKKKNGMTIHSSKYGQVRTSTKQILASNSCHGIYSKVSKFTIFYRYSKGFAVFFITCIIKSGNPHHYHLSTSDKWRQIWSASNFTRAIILFESHNNYPDISLSSFKCKKIIFFTYKIARNSRV